MGVIYATKARSQEIDKFMGAYCKTVTAFEDLAKVRNESGNVDTTVAWASDVAKVPDCALKATFEIDGDVVGNVTVGNQSIDIVEVHIIAECNVVEHTCFPNPHEEYIGKRNNDTRT